MKNINEINEILCQQIDLLVEKKSTPKEVNAICNATATLIRNVKLQIDYAKLTGKEPNVALMQTSEQNHPENVLLGPTPVTA